MAIMFSGSGAINHDVVIFGHLRIWAERGLIHIEDSRDNSYKVVNVKTMLHRMKAVQDAISNSRKDKRQAHSYSQFDNHWLSMNQDMIDQMILVIEKAKVQGMPSDPTACRDLKRRLPVSIIVPGRNTEL